MKYLPVALLALSACGMSAEEGRKFNDKLVALTKQLESAGMDFGMSIGAQLASDSPDAAAVDGAIKKAQSALKSVEAEIAGLKVPDNAKARAFHDAFKKFLGGQAEIINVHFKALADLALDPNVSESEKQEKTADILKKAEAVEKAGLTEVRAAQQAFAREFGATIQ